MRAPIRTLVVDDSAFARKVVREILASSRLVDVVGSARDGEEALELSAQLKPDLVICDLRMPRMNGVSYIRRQMALRPLPILVFSAAPGDAAEVLEALNAGAIEVVKKPTALATDDLRSVQDSLVAKIRAAMDIRVDQLASEPAPALRLPAGARAGQAAIVVIGISTGGPQALRRVLPALPADFPVPIAIVLHMPVGYTALYAEKLNELCAIEVKEAAEGDELRPGLALLAAAGRHLTFVRTAADEVVAQLPLQPLDRIHRPSVDVMFRSAAEIYADGVLAVVMTGMGDDGREGAGWVKAQGGTVLTEAEKSCVIYGMPRSVAEAGLSDAAIPLEDMAQAITDRL